MTDEMMFNPDQLPTRDALGHVFHPDLPEYEVDEPIGPKLRSLGFQPFIVDLPEELFERYATQEEPDCSWWTPTPPEGAHWRLAAIFDTEDGPSALYVCLFATLPKPPIQTWAVYERPLDAPDAVIARLFLDEFPTATTHRAATVAEVIAMLPAGLTRLPSMEGDVPYLVGVWA